MNAKMASMAGDNTTSASFSIPVELLTKIPRDMSEGDSVSLSVPDGSGKVKHIQASCKDGNLQIHVTSVKREAESPRRSSRQRNVKSARELLGLTKTGGKDERGSDADVYVIPTSKVSDLVAKDKPLVLEKPSGGDVEVIADARQVATRISNRKRTRSQTISPQVNDVKTSPKKQVKGTEKKQPSSKGMAMNRVQQYNRSNKLNASNSSGKNKSNEAPVRDIVVEAGVFVPTKDTSSYLSVRSTRATKTRAAEVDQSESTSKSPTAVKTVKRQGSGKTAAEIVSMSPTSTARGSKSPRKVTASTTILNASPTQTPSELAMESRQEHNEISEPMLASSGSIDASEPPTPSTGSLETMQVNPVPTSDSVEKVTSLPITQMPLSTESSQSNDMVMSTSEVPSSSSLQCTDLSGVPLLCTASISTVSQPSSGEITISYAQTEPVGAMDIGEESGSSHHPTGDQTGGKVILAYGQAGSGDNIAVGEHSAIEGGSSHEATDVQTSGGDGQQLVCEESPPSGEVQGPPPGVSIVVQDSGIEGEEKVIEMAHLASMETQETTQYVTVSEAVDDAGSPPSKKQCTEPTETVLSLPLSSEMVLTFSDGKAEAGAVNVDSKAGEGMRIDDSHRLAAEAVAELSRLPIVGTTSTLSDRISKATIDASGMITLHVTPDQPVASVSEGYAKSAEEAPAELPKKWCPLIPQVGSRRRWQSEIKSSKRDGKIEIPDPKLYQMWEDVEPSETLEDHCIITENMIVKNHRQVKKKIIQCKYCKEYFHVKRYFLSHLNKHVKFQPYKCPLCDYGVQFKYTLANHMNTHAEEKPFKCELCGKTFTFRQKLQLHMKYHNDERGCKCPFCNMAFHECKTLKSHIAKIHPEGKIVPPGSISEEIVKDRFPRSICYGTRKLDKRTSIYRLEKEKGQEEEEISLQESDMMVDNLEDGEGGDGEGASVDDTEQVDEEACVDSPVAEEEEEHGEEAEQGVHEMAEETAVANLEETQTSEETEQSSQEDSVGERQTDLEKVAEQEEEESGDQENEHVSEEKGVDNEEDSEEKGVDNEEDSEEKGVDAEEDSEEKGVDNEEDSEEKGVDNEEDSEEKGVDAEEDSEEKGVDNEEDSEEKCVDNEEDSEEKGVDAEEDSEEKGVDAEEDSEEKCVDNEEDSEEKGVDAEEDSEEKGVDNEEDSEEKGVDAEEDSEEKGVDNEEDSEEKGVDAEQDGEEKGMDVEQDIEETAEENQQPEEESEEQSQEAEQKEEEGEGESSQDKEGQESSPTELNEKPAVKVKKKRPRVQVPDQFLEDYCIIMEKQVRNVIDQKMSTSVSYLCKICPTIDTALPSKTKFLKHLFEQHPDIKPWKCTLCDFSCRSRTSLPVHMKIHSGDKNHVCTLCGKAFTFKQKLRSHMQYHENLRPFCCQVCDKRFNNKSDLTKHRKRMHDIEWLICTECGRAFKERVRFNRHMEVHANPNSHVCEYCHKVYASKESLQMHVKSHTCVFHCEICNKNFGSYSGFMAHKTMHDESFEGYNCDLCSQVLMTRASLYRHRMVTHSNNRPFSCEVCDKTFKTKKDLKSHHACHSMVKPYECKICGLGCKRPESLKVHMLRHAEVKPFKCGLCGKEYTQKHALEVHLSCHIGAKENTCTFCNKAFNTKYQLQKHVDVHHKALEGQTGIPVTETKGVTYVKAKQGSLEVGGDDGKGETLSVFMCEECNGIYLTQESLAVHILSEHMNKQWVGGMGAKVSVDPQTSTIDGMVETTGTIDAEQMDAEQAVIVLEGLATGGGVEVQSMNEQEIAIDSIHVEEQQLEGNHHTGHSVAETVEIPLSTTEEEAVVFMPGLTDYTTEETV